MDRFSEALTIFMFLALILSLPLSLSLSLSYFLLLFVENCCSLFSSARPTSEHKTVLKVSDLLCLRAHGTQGLHLRQMSNECEFISRGSAIFTAGLYVQPPNRAATSVCLRFQCNSSKYQQAPEQAPDQQMQLLCCKNQTWSKRVRVLASFKSWVSTSAQIAGTMVFATEQHAFWVGACSGACCSFKRRKSFSF
jgi:hypothetical protein